MFLVYFKSGPSSRVFQDMIFEIFSIADRIFHSLVVFAMFATHSFMLL